MYNYVCTRCNCNYEYHLKVKRKYCPTCAVVVVSEQQKKYQEKHLEEKALRVRPNYKSGCENTGYFTINQMLEIQKMVRDRNKTHIHYKNIKDRFPTIKESALKTYVKRLIRDEKYKIYTEEI